MNEPVKQHLIDPEVCIRCYTCEPACPIGAIEHDGTNVVVKAEACNFCMSCIPVCPTGSIDEWRVVATPYHARRAIRLVGTAGAGGSQRRRSRDRGLR